MTALAWKRELGLSGELVTGDPKDTWEIGMLITGCWEAWDGLPGRTLDLRGSQIQVPWGLAERRLESKRVD